MSAEQPGRRDAAKDIPHIPHIQLWQRDIACTENGNNYGGAALADVRRARF
jgi:hypothetical protein